MIDKIDWKGIIYAPSSCEGISSWVADVVWGMDGKPLMQNAWRKTGYDCDWFPTCKGVIISNAVDNRWIIFLDVPLLDSTISYE